MVYVDRMAVIRIARTVPPQDRPYVDVPEGELCYVVNGYGECILANPRTLRERGRIFPAVLSRVWFQQAGMAQDELESSFVEAATKMSGIPIHQHNHKGTLHVLYSQTDGISIAMIISTVPAQQMARDDPARKPSWDLLLGDDFLKDER